MFFEGVDVQRFQSAVRKWYNQLHPTCRRSASPRATGLGTGTAGEVGAPPSPVRPWFSSSDSRSRKKPQSAPSHRRGGSPKTNPAPFPCAIQIGDQYRTHWYISRHHLRLLSKTGEEIKKLPSLWHPSQWSSTFPPARRNRSRSPDDVKGRLHFYGDSMRTRQQHLSRLSYAWTHCLLIYHQPLHKSIAYKNCNLSHWAVWLHIERLWLS